MKKKLIYIILAFQTVLLILTLGWQMTENGKPIMTKLEQAVEKFDGNFSNIITVELDQHNLFVFYETTNRTLRIVYVENDYFGRVNVEGFIGETSLVQTEKVLSWHGRGNVAPGYTELLYGIIFDPTITQLFVNSEDDQMASIIQIDEQTALWYLFLDDEMRSPITLTALDKMGNELYYFGPR